MSTKKNVIVKWRIDKKSLKRKIKNISSIFDKSFHLFYIINMMNLILW